MLEVLRKKELICKLCLLNNPFSMQMISNNSAFGCKNVTDGLYLSWKVDSNTQSIIGRGGGGGGGGKRHCTRAMIPQF